MTPTQSYLDILYSAIEYHKAAYVWCFVGFVFFTAFILFIPKIKKKKPQKPSKYQYHCVPKKEFQESKKEFPFKLVAWCLLTCICICGFAYTNHQIKKIETDIENGSFVTFTGSFHYFNYRGKGTDHFFTRIDLLDESQNTIATVHHPDYKNYHSTYEKDEYQFIEEGFYHGTLVYAKESGLVVKLQIDE